MAVENIWWWFKEPSAKGDWAGTDQGGIALGNQGLASGSLVANIGPQSAVYAFAALQGLRYSPVPESEAPFIGFDTSCYVASYTKGGVSQVAGTPGIFDTDVDSVTFVWELASGWGVANTQVTFQIFGFGAE
jgi:hypothetical protein